MWAGDPAATPAIRRPAGDTPMRDGVHRADGTEPRDPRPIRRSKKAKPYLCCNACGVQLFIRTGDGIVRPQ